MPDRRRKRSRNHHHQQQQQQQQRKKVRANVEEIIAEQEEEEAEAAGEEGKTEDKEYRVESPTAVKVSTSERKKTPIKSKSLDDDDLLRIQELSETSEAEDVRSECKAIVSEAESDVEWEMTEIMEEPELQTGVLSSLDLLPPESCTTTEQVALISPEEELTLRNFLEGLNLINSPDDAARRVEEVSTMESVRTRRAKKRAALEQYFTPMVQNPRYLDVISEETGEVSDREQPIQHLKQGTPEPELPPKPPKVRPKRSRMQAHFPAPVISNPTILVGAKIVDVPVVGHGFASTTKTEQASDKAELVYLEDSSNSTTPDPRSDDDDNDDDVDEGEDREKEKVEEKSQVKVSVKKNEVLVVESECLEEKVDILTPPPSPNRESVVETVQKHLQLEKEHKTEGSDRQMVAAEKAEQKNEGTRLRRDVEKDVLVKVVETKEAEKKVFGEKQMENEETKSEIAEEIPLKDTQQERIKLTFEDMKNKKEENTVKFTPDKEETEMEKLGTIKYDFNANKYSPTEINDLLKRTEKPFLSSVEEKKSEHVLKNFKSSSFEEKVKMIEEKKFETEKYSTGSNKYSSVTSISSEASGRKPFLSFAGEKEEIKSDVASSKRMQFTKIASDKKEGVSGTEKIITTTIEGESNKNEAKKSEKLHQQPSKTSVEEKLNLETKPKTSYDKAGVERIIKISIEGEEIKNEERKLERIHREPFKTVTEEHFNLEIKPKTSDNKGNVERIIKVSIEGKENRNEEKISEIIHQQHFRTSAEGRLNPKSKPETSEKKGGVEKILKISIEGEETKNEERKPERIHREPFKTVTEETINLESKSKTLDKTRGIEKIIKISMEDKENKNEEKKSETIHQQHFKTSAEEKLNLKSEPATSEKKGGVEKIIKISIEGEETKNEERKPEGIHREPFKTVVEETLNLETKSKTLDKTRGVEKIIKISMEDKENKNEERKSERIHQQSFKTFAEEKLHLETAPKLSEKKGGVEKIIKISVEARDHENEERQSEKLVHQPTFRSFTEEKVGLCEEMKAKTSSSKYTECIKNVSEKKQEYLEVGKFTKVSLEEKGSKDKEIESEKPESKSKTTPIGHTQRLEDVSKKELSGIEKLLQISIEERRNGRSEDDNEPKSEKVIPMSIEEDHNTPKYTEFKKRTCLKPSPSKEVEGLCSAKISLNVLSPHGPSPSPSLSSGSSSRATSLCTAKYNPMGSSIADISSISEEDMHRHHQPGSLRELCLAYLMSRPYGADVLQELAEVSESIEALTARITGSVFDRKEASDSGPLTSAPTRRPDLDIKKAADDEHVNRASYHESGDDDEPMEDRLRAKDLNEWLRLARRSTSLSDLTEGSSFEVRTKEQRRTSLPQDFYERQMDQLREKEREIQRELEQLEEEKRKLEMNFRPEELRDVRRASATSMPSTEVFRKQMYEEYMDKMAKMEERKQQKVIKVTLSGKGGEGAKAAGIKDEFMDKVKEKRRLGKLYFDTDEEVEDGGGGGGPLPKHLREFADFTELAEGGVWSPGQQKQQQYSKIQQDGGTEQQQQQQDKEQGKDEPISPVWTPKSATSSPTSERKEFRPVKFESPVLSRKNYSQIEEPPVEDTSSKDPPWRAPETSSDTGLALSSTLQKRLPTSHSSPASGFNDFSTTRLPKAQNPTITLLQKAREGQLPKGALYIEQDQQKRAHQNEKPPLVGPGEIRKPPPPPDVRFFSQNQSGPAVYRIKNEYTSESDGERPRKMVDLGPRKFEGIGPTTKDGMPLILRSEVKDANQSKWYKKMYDTIHKQRPHKDEFVTVRYKQRRGQYPYTSGYLSEPEHGAYDSDYADYKYATLDRRRVPVRDKENDYLMSSTMPRTGEHRGAEVIKHGHDPYKNQPGRIENYIPGHSSISEKEAKEWWDEVMDIFDGWLDDNSALPSYDYMFSRALAKSHLEQQKRVPQTKSFINQALKESGYESDSTLIFRRRDDTVQQLSPSEQKEAYKIIQKGGDIPLHGLRKPAPERPKESPRKYVENEVTIHYKTPVRQEIKEYLSEDELAYRQAEAMKKIYQEERRRKYLQVSKSLQELQDMNNRRHTDNFIPSQKSPIPLNRYDDFDELSPPVKPRPRSPEPRLIARALYNFVGQTARELTFRKGDLIYVRRQVDKNWYEGELNAMVGLFPVNYVEIVPYDTAKSTPRKSHEGQARAKYNFVAQTHLELSLAKGELVVITRRVDDNWFEGKIGGRKGIFPVSYVEVLIDPSDPPPPPTSKPVAAPAAHSLLLNGSAGGKESMGSHSYTPTLAANQLTTSYHAKPVQVTTGNYGSLSRNKNPVNQTLHIETQAEPVPYRALYKYLPQNDDELELLEGDTVYVLEKCDDGWYVGSSERTGAFGTFPGNYVEKI